MFYIVKNTRPRPPTPDPMPRSDTPGELEELVLLAVLRLGEEGYGARIRELLRERAGRSLSVSAIYTTLMRLEEKGLVESELGEPTARRGGRAKRFFRLTGAGVRAVREARHVRERMWEGLEDAADAAVEDGHAG